MKHTQWTGVQTPTERGEKVTGSNSRKAFRRRDTSHSRRSPSCAWPGILALLCLVACLTGCMNSMPVGVGAFPKTIDIADGRSVVCDRAVEGRTGVGADRRCEDVTDYTEGQRNQLQHVLLGIATQECHDFKSRLYGWTRFGIASGGVAHLMTSASAVSTHVPTSQLMAGVASLSTAVDGDVGAYFRESKLSVALGGIEIARTRIFRQIKDKKGESVLEYPVSRAFNDALRYHGVCTLPEGISESASAVEDAIARAATED